MRDQAMQIQRQLAAETVEVEEDGIKIVMTGDQKIQSIEIDGQSQEKLVDVINRAIKRSQEVAAHKLQEMGGLGGLGGMFGG